MTRGQRTKTSTRKQLLALLISLGVCFAAAGVGSLFTSMSVTTWYPTLTKPEWTPPGWVFGPVWSTLYAMMAVAAWLVWRRGGSEAQPALRIFALQLGLNVLWSVLFFGLRLPGVALAEIIFLWLAIGATARVFGRISTSAGLLFVPYFVWVGFAAILNFAIWRLNA